MATSNEEIQDALIRHQTYLLRYSGSVRNRIISLLEETEGSVRALIENRLSDSANSLLSDSDYKRYEKLTTAIERLRKGAWQEANAFLKEEMEELAVAEPNMFKDMFEQAVPVDIVMDLPPRQSLKAIATSRPFQGKLLREWADSMESADLSLIKRQIQLGMTAGETNRQITSRVMGSGGVKDQTRAGVNAVVRTAVQHVANNARKETLLENSAFIEWEVFVATLDSRTTVVCMATDGKRFKPGKGKYPPLHMGCRSLRAATADGNVLGTRPMKPTTERELVEQYAKRNNLGSIRSRANLPYGTKTDFDLWSRKEIRNRIGSVPAKTTYNEFLRRQSKAFQEETLGVTKARLFREGNLSLDKFVARDGSELTLSELASKYTSSFKEAGLEVSSF